MNRVCPLCGSCQDNAEPISFEEALTFGAVVAMLTRPGPGYDKAREEYAAALNKLMESLQPEPDCSVKPVNCMDKTNVTEKDNDEG